jgi:hypothetical protein
MMPKIGTGGTGNIDSVQMDEQASTPATPAAGKSVIFLKADGLYVVDDAGDVTGPLVSAAGGGYTQGARVYNNANISIGNDSWTALTFNSERYDTDTIHDTTTNTGRLTCVTAGKYVISGHVRFPANNANYRSVAIKLNGTTYMAIQKSVNMGAGEAVMMSVSTIYSLSATDYVELVVHQNSGGALNVEYVANYSPEFAMQRIG